jgi:hypothetical protein
MRVATIYWNRNTDVTEIRFSEQFLHSDQFLHLDVLKDSFCDLEAYYNNLLHEKFRHLRLEEIVLMTKDAINKNLASYESDEASERYKNWKEINDAFEAGCDAGREYERQFHQDKLEESK